MKNTEVWEDRFADMSKSDPDFLFKGARTMLARKDFVKAEYIYKAIIDLLPDSLEAVTELIITLHQLGKVKEAVDIAKQYSSLGFLPVYIREIMCACLYETGQTTEALTAINEVLDDSPSSPLALAMLVLFETDTLNLSQSFPLEMKKKQDVILINSPYWLIGAPNCGLGCISEALRFSKISFSLLDLNHIFYNNLPKKHKALFMPEKMIPWFDPGLFRILAVKLQTFIEESAQYIVTNSMLAGFSVSFTSRNFSLALARAVKQIEPDFPVIFGGYDCIRETSIGYSPDVDAFVIGEGDASFPALVLEYLRKNTQDMTQIPGVYYPGKTFKPSTPYPLDSVPFPHYTELDLNGYTNEMKKKVLAINTSRSCVWGKCTFCSIKRSSYRQRTAKSIYEEIRYHYIHNNITRFIFSDVQAGGTPENLIALAELLAKDREIEVFLEGQIRFSHILLPAFPILKEAGFTYIQFGLESGSASTLKRMKKGISLNLARKTLRACHEAGIDPGIFIITGFPGEVEDEHLATLNFLEEMSEYIRQIETVNVFVIAYGSPYWQELERGGWVCDEFANVIIDDWKDEQTTLEIREQRRREIIDKAASFNISTGLFIKDGATMDLVRFFWERGEHQRAENVLSLVLGSQGENSEIVRSAALQGESPEVLKMITEHMEKNGFDPETSLYLIKEYLKIGKPEKALLILEKQQQYTACFHPDFHLLAEVIHKKLDLSYIESDLFEYISEQFREEIKGALDGGKTHAKALVVGSSFLYHSLLTVRAIKKLNCFNEITLLAKEADKKIFSPFLPDSLICFSQESINCDLITENHIIQKGVGSWGTIIVLVNQSSAGAYNNVFEFSKALNPQNIITITWDGKAVCGLPKNKHTAASA